MRAIVKLVILWWLLFPASPSPIAVFQSVAPATCFGAVVPVTLAYDGSGERPIGYDGTILNTVCRYDIGTVFTQDGNHSPGVSNGGFLDGVRKFLAAKGGASIGQAASRDYRATFFAANPELEGQVVVDHAVEQQVLTKCPGVVIESEIHSLENLRGIPTGINSDIHLSQIRVEWNNFYKPFKLSGTAPSKAALLQKASEIDAKYGSKFTPPIGGAR